MIDQELRLFELSMSFMCGIPSITLLGSEVDWNVMLERIRPLAEGKYGNAFPDCVLERMN